MKPLLEKNNLSVGIVSGRIVLSIQLILTGKTCLKTSNRSSPEFIPHLMRDEDDDEKVREDDVGRFLR